MTANGSSSSCEGWGGGHSQPPKPKTLNEVLDEDITMTAKSLCEYHGQEWDKLNDQEKQDYLTEASFTFSWLC